MATEPENTGVEALTEELSAATQAFKAKSDEIDTHFKDMKAHFDGAKEADAETKAKVDQAAADFGELSRQYSNLEGVVANLEKQLDQPIHRGGADLAEKDRENAIELQRRIYLHGNGTDEGFSADLDDLVDMHAYRGAVRKWMQFGIKSRGQIIASFTPEEKKAFEAGSLDSAMFSPELLGYEQDCDPESAYMLDLYGAHTVSKSSYQYPVVKDYGAIGQYVNDHNCDGPFGPEGNIAFQQGRTKDWRGTFAFQLKVLQEANFDLLGFMMRAVNRSYRINRNRAMISGDGVHEALGWLTADQFEKKDTRTTGDVDHEDYRMFVLGAPLEYGPVVSAMHQNVLAMLATQVDDNKRFIFADGALAITPDTVRDAIRVTNHLPDPTEGLTKGVTTTPMDSGAFVMAAANWERAVGLVSKRPLFMQQVEGRNTPWCVMYMFGAEDDGFLHCGDAGRVLRTK